MLLHAFFAPGAGSALPASGDRAADLALLTAVSMCFALARHGRAVQAPGRRRRGPLPTRVLPGLRTLRPHLARIADGANPVAVQAMFAAAMLSADPVTSGVYYVDDHFVPYTGPGRSRKDGTTSGAAPSGAAPIPMSPPMTGGRCAS